MALRVLSSIYPLICSDFVLCFPVLFIDGALFYLRTLNGPAAPPYPPSDLSVRLALCCPTMLFFIIAQ